MDPESVSLVAESMFKYWKIIGDSGELEEKRNKQLTQVRLSPFFAVPSGRFQWMWSHVRDEIMSVFTTHPRIAAMAPKLENDIRHGLNTPGMAAETMIKAFLGI